MQGIEMMCEAIVNLDVIGVKRTSFGGTEAGNNSRDRENPVVPERRDHPGPERRRTRLRVLGHEA